MTIVKRIVCLANSRKLNGRCIAGIEFPASGQAGGWLRPVSAREHEEVSEYERQYRDGSDPRVLDIIDVPLLEPKPRGCQQENWLLDPEPYWVHTGRMGWNQLAPLVTNAATLWINGRRTFHGMNDEIPLETANTLDSSLCLIHVDGIELRVFAPGHAFGNAKRRVQGCFSYRDIEYRLWVTDPIFERRYLAQEDGSYPLGECFLTISIGEPYNDACYKLIAAIIPRP